jgi:hypothetical protein
MVDVMPDLPPDDGDALLDPDFDDDGEGWLAVLLLPQRRDTSMDDWIG